MGPSVLCCLLLCSKIFIKHASLLLQVAFEEAGVSFFKAGHPLLESEQRQWDLEDKKETEEDASLWGTE